MQGINTFFLDLSLPSGQHFNLMQDLILGPSAVSKTQRGKSHELSFSLHQFPECGIFDVLEQDFGQILTLPFPAVPLQLIGGGCKELLRAHGHALN